MAIVSGRAAVSASSESFASRQATVRSQATCRAKLRPGRHACHYRCSA